jgi:hypothetical protein
MTRPGRIDYGKATMPQTDLPTLVIDDLRGPNALVVAAAMFYRTKHRPHVLFGFLADYSGDATHKIKSDGS